MSVNKYHTSMVGFSNLCFAPPPKKKKLQKIIGRLKNCSSDQTPRPANHLRSRTSYSFANQRNLPSLPRSPRPMECNLVGSKMLSIVFSRERTELYHVSIYFYSIKSKKYSTIKNGRKKQNSLTIKTIALKMQTNNLTLNS